MGHYRFLELMFSELIMNTKSDLYKEGKKILQVAILVKLERLLWVILEFNIRIFWV